MDNLKERKKNNKKLKLKVKRRDAKMKVLENC
jgi:hypothetical protein